MWGRVYNRVKKAQGGTGANQYLQSRQNDGSAKTSATLAKEYGVSPQVSPYYHHRCHHKR